MANPIFESLGTSIFETMSRLAAECGAINLGQGFPEGLETHEVVHAAAEALRTGPHQYAPMLGTADLRRAVAENTKRFLGVQIDGEREVLVTSGATEGLADSILGLISVGDEVIVLEPAYDSYAPLLRQAGATVVPVRLEAPDFALPLDVLEAAITPRTRALVINTPMNPIGKVFSKDELLGLSVLMDKYDLIAICDEVYEHLVFGEHQHLSLFTLPGMRQRVVRVGSAGKTFSLTGWKVGYVTACPELLAPIARAHQFITFSTPPALQTAVAYGLRLAAEHFLQLKRQLEMRRDLLVPGLRQLGFKVPDVAATYFAIASKEALDPEGDDRVFCERMTREARVTAIPLSAFYGSRPERRYLRFCFAKDPQSLTQSLEHLEHWLSRR